LRFNKTLNKIPEEKRPNAPVILGCYKNVMPANVKFSIRASQIENLDEAMGKATEMEEIMFETGVDPDIILGKVRRQIDNLAISDQGASSSKKNEDKKTHHLGNQGVGGGFFKGTIPNVKIDPVAAQETKQKIEIAQMNRTIRQMQNEIIRLRRNENFMLDSRMSSSRTKKKSCSRTKRTRIENTNDQQRQRIPREPNPNAVILEEAYDEQTIEQEVDYIQEEILESVETDGCETSMYIFEEDEENTISQDNVVQTRGQLNKSKPKENVEKEKENKEKEKEKEKNKSSEQRRMVNTPQMMYNVVDDLSKLRITLPFTEVVKIPQQRENILKLLDEPGGRIEVVIANPKQNQTISVVKLRGKVPPFYISIENHDVVLHNCLIDSRATNNIMPLEVMEALGMSCTKYYETGESIYAIDSRKVPAYGEIKDFYAWIIVAPHIITVFTIIVVDLPPTYGVVLGRDWSSMIGGYIMNDGSCMMLAKQRWDNVESSS
jgi:hypothetical protein